MTPQTLAGTLAIVGDYPNAYEVALGRIDVIPRGYSVHTIVAGILLDGSNPSEGALPLDNIDEADFTVLTDMLSEVEGRMLSGELSCIDPESLTNKTILGSSPSSPAPFMP